MANARELIGTNQNDNLIYSNQPPPLTKTIQLASGQGVLERGTVIAFPEATPGEDGVAWTGATGTVTGCVLWDDVDTGGTTGDTVVGHAYRAASLTRQALKFGQGATEITAAAEQQLRYGGILLNNMVM